MTRQTSAEVYRRIEAEGLLSKQRWRAYEHIYSKGPVTGSELNAGLASKSGHKRLSELQELGCVREVGIRECRVTGERVIAWDVTDTLPRAAKKKHASTGRPTRAEVIATLREMGARHKERALCDETIRVMNWLVQRFNVPKWKETTT